MKEQKPGKILIVDDNEDLLKAAKIFLKRHFGQVDTETNPGLLPVLIVNEQYDVIMLDMNFTKDVSSGQEGFYWLDRILELDSSAVVVLITAYGDVNTAVKAIKEGATDFVLKPWENEKLLATLNAALQLRQSKLEVSQLKKQQQQLYQDIDSKFKDIIGQSPAMVKVFETIERVAGTDANVLILGENGTGKELIARAIHRQGPAPDARFLPINCAAIPAELLESQLFGRRKGAFTGADRDQAGLFVHAGEGTVFLDEIGELPPAMQAKLLRSIEQKEVQPVGANEPVTVEARVLAATNKDLKREVAEGRFREDLFYRLNVVMIPVPPLRERRDDIPELVDFLLAKQARAIGKRITGVTHEAMQLLRSCPWKGNVRELENALQRAVILGEGPLVTAADLPPDLTPTDSDPTAVDDLGEAVRRFEKLHIERMLRLAPDKKEAARRLNMGLSSLYRRIAELGIQTGA